MKVFNYNLFKCLTLDIKAKISLYLYIYKGKAAI